jgi:hypothetical protein
VKRSGKQGDVDQTTGGSNFVVATGAVLSPDHGWMTVTAGPHSQYHVRSPVSRLHLLVLDSADGVRGLKCQGTCKVEIVQGGD